MSVSLHRFTRNFMEFLSRRVHRSFPEQGATSYSSYTLQRWVTLPMRDLKLCCTAGSMFLFKLPWFEAQPKIQANHCPLRDPICLHDPPGLTPPPLSLQLGQAITLVSSRRLYEVVMPVVSSIKGPTIPPAATHK